MARVIAITCLLLLVLSGCSISSGAQNEYGGILHPSSDVVSANDNDETDILKSITGTKDDVKYFIALLDNYQEIKDNGYIDDECYNITPNYIMEYSEYRIFKYNKSCASYLLYDNEIFPIGEWFGGYGVTDMTLADIDNDNEPELYFTFSWGSGIHRSLAGYFHPIKKEIIIFDYTHWHSDMVILLDNGGLSLYDAILTNTAETVDFINFSLIVNEHLADIVFIDAAIELSINE